MPYGLTAPRCYQVSQEGEEYWLWLEEVQDDFGKPWSITQHYEVARNLGCFNGAYLMGKPLPDQPWLSRHWLRKYVEDAAPVVQILPELRKLPLRSFDIIYIDQAARNDRWLPPLRVSKDRHDDAGEGEENRGENEAAGGPGSHRPDGMMLPGCDIVSPRGWRGGTTHSFRIPR